jgi:predicted permease
MAEWMTSLRLRLRGLLHPRRHERDIADEMAFHLTMREAQLRSSGAADPTVRARRRFGNATRTREDLRELWAIAPRAGALWLDLRYASRALRQRPGFAIVVILTLGLGIGATTAFFTVVNAVLIRPFGYADADRLISIHERFPGAGLDHLPFSPLDFEDLRRHQQSFETVAAYRTVVLELSGGGPPERIAGAKVSAETFDLLGVAPIVGRTFSADDDRPGANVAILSGGLWQRRYASNPSILGQTIQLDRQAYTVVGVMPGHFAFPRRGPRFNGEPADVWLPIAFTPRERTERGTLHANSVVGRLKKGVALSAAQAELELIATLIGTQYSQAQHAAGFSPRLAARPLREEVSGRFERPLVTLLAAVLLVLLVACANTANLILSRMATRTREFAVRTAIGASRAQLARLLFCEAAVLSGAGGLIGIAFAYGATRAAPLVLTRTIPGLQDLQIDVRVLAFTTGLCLLTAIVFALVPLPTLDRRGPGDALRDDSSRTTSGARARYVQGSFVVVTVGLACVLLAGAGLLIRSFASLIAFDAGFRSAQVLTASLTLPRTVYPTAASVRTFRESLSGRLAALPGVRSAALATDLPLTTYDVRAFTLEGTTPEGALRTTNLSWVHGPYFETLGMTLARGRFFAADEHAQVRNVVIVNEKLAVLAWPGQDPLGKRIKWGGAESRAPWLTVVGVIRNVADGPIGAEPGVHAYEPFRQLPDFFLNGAPNQFGRDVSVAILTDVDPRALAPLVRREIAGLDPALAVERIDSMDEKVRDVVAPQRFSAWLVGVFAAIASLLAAIGLYGLLAFTIAQRQREIAVRMALGAERRVVMSMVAGHGARLVATGLLVGLVSSLALARVIASLLFRTSPYDLVAFAAIPAVLVPVALMATAIPAWRATRVEPVAALRGD